MRFIGRRYMCYGLLLALSVFFTVWLDPRQYAGASILWSFLIVLLMGLFIRQSQIVQGAKLIWDNRILVISVRTGTAQVVDEVVLSTFGLLSAGYIYDWGRRGLWGIRLKAIEVDRKKMCLCFGNKRHAIRIEFRHGIDTKENILEVTDKLWRETGVKATIQG